MNTLEISLRPATVPDLDLLFAIQAKRASLHMAAFTSKESENRDAYIAKWTRLLPTPSVSVQCILFASTLVGCIARFEVNNEVHLTYVVDQQHWRKGIASEAVHQFLKLELRRPVFARTAHDNLGSQRVLEKNAFQRVGQNTAFANARQMDILEYIYRLDQKH